jgi:hypothetical protein
MEIGIAVSVGLIVLLAVFSPKIRRAYLKARGEMRAATAKKAREEFITLKSAYAHQASAEGARDSEEPLGAHHHDGLVTHSAHLGTSSR